MNDHHPRLHRAAGLALVLGGSALAVLAGACDVDPAARTGGLVAEDQTRMHVSELPDGASGDSCVARCGTWTTGATCQCDDECGEYGDCCDDLEVLCTEDDGGVAKDPLAEYCYDVVDELWDGIADEEAMLEAINERRQHEQDCGTEGVFAPAPPLSLDPSAQCAARNHSMNMAKFDFFAHNDPEGRRVKDRLDLAGESFMSVWGENIHGGSPTAEEAVDSLIKSDGHCANIMSPDFTRVGVGHHPGPTVHPVTAEPLHHLWTQVFWSP
ncbi:MAG: CAP domain-containing protein [Myxococcota bacterium]